MPTRIKPEVRNLTLSETQRKAKASLIYCELALLMEELAGRWADEGAYEDIADYALPINKELKSHGVKVLKMTKRPFGFTYVLADATYAVTCSVSGRYEYKRIA